VNATALKLEQFDLLAFLTGAQDDSEWCGFAGFRLVTLEPTQVQFHLAFKFRFELTDLQVDHHQAFELAIVEQEVDVKIVIIDLNAFLLLGLTSAPCGLWPPCDESESRAHLEQETLEVTQDHIFEVFLEIPVLEIQNFASTGLSRAIPVKSYPRIVTARGHA
jgi:hypothetical protein